MYMKAIILSAGQGKRLLPLTARLPKCLLEVKGKSLLEWQVSVLQSCGINTITVVTGYGADEVVALLRRNSSLHSVQTLYNPDYPISDNLVSCWKVREQMQDDFVLLNGDNLFEAAVLKKLLATPETPITVTINHKDRYDADDMKVSLAGTQLTKIGKTLSAGETHGESIGMILFRGIGPKVFTEALAHAISQPQAAHRWYLSVIDAIAQKKTVQTCSIEGLQWCEVDCPADLIHADSVVTNLLRGQGCAQADARRQGQKASAA